jgi:hypothetical protein
VEAAAETSVETVAPAEFVSPAPVASAPETIIASEPLAAEPALRRSSHR